MAKFGIGQSVRRVEDPRLLTGGGRYTDDTKLSAPAARAYVLRSPHAHADIRSIDTSAAKKAPGVLLVLTGEDVKAAGYGDLPCLVPVTNRDGTPRGETPRPLLAQGRGKVFARDDILNHLRGHEAELYTRAVDIVVSRLRKKLEPLDAIKTLRNAGYQLALRSLDEGDGVKR